MNRTPPAATGNEGSDLEESVLAVIGTLARTYDAQRLRLLELGEPGAPTLPSTLSPLGELEQEVWLDGRPVSASIVDTVVQAREILALRPVTPPLQVGSDAFMAAQGGWWDALLGDVERRCGLAPRTIRIALPAETGPSVRAVFADRATT